MTLKDIQLNRYVDHVMDWTEQTQFGTIINHNRYDEQQYLQYCETVPNFVDSVKTSHLYNLNAQDVSCSPLPLNSKTSISDCTPSSMNEPTRVWIPQPEKQALILCKGDIHYREAQHRAKRRLEPCEARIPPHLLLEESNEPTLQKHTIRVDVKSIKSSPARSDSLSPTTQVLPITVGPQLSAVQERGVHGESFNSFATTEITHLHQQGLCIHHNKSEQLHRPSPFIRTEV